MINNENSLESQALTTVGPTTPVPEPVTSTTTTLGPCEKNCLWEWKFPQPFTNKKGYWRQIVNPCPSQCPCFAPEDMGFYNGQQITTLCGGSRPHGPIQPCNRYCLWVADNNFGNPRWVVSQNPCPEECPCPPPTRLPYPDNPNLMYAATYCGQASFGGSTTTPIPLSACSFGECVWKNVMYTEADGTQAWRWKLVKSCHENGRMSTLCVCDKPVYNQNFAGETTTACRAPVSCSGTCTWKYNGSMWFVDMTQGSCPNCVCDWPYPPNMPGELGATLPGVCVNERTKPVLETCNGVCSFIWKQISNYGYWEQLTTCTNTCLGCSFPNYKGNLSEIAHTKCVPAVGTPNPNIPTEPEPLDCRGVCFYRYVGVIGYGYYALDNEKTTCNHFCATCPGMLSIDYVGETYSKTCQPSDLQIIVPPKPINEGCQGNCVYTWSDFSNKYLLNDTKTSCNSYDDCFPCWAVLNVGYRGNEIAVPCSGRPAYTTTPEPQTTPPPPCNPYGNCSYRWQAIPPTSFWDNPFWFLVDNLGNPGYWSLESDTCYSTRDEVRCFCPRFPVKSI